MRRLNICQTCRAFFEPDQKVCPHCGTSIVHRMVREHGGIFDRLASRRFEMTLLIILVNALIYVGCVVLSGGFRTGGEGGFLRTFGAVDPEIVLKLGGANYYHVAKGGEWWRLVCPIFLHFSLIHILFNCYVIRFAGQIAESAYGSAKFFCMYLVTGVAGALVSLVWYKIGLGAGASGAAFGIIGMAGVYGIRRRDEGLRRMMFQWAFIAFAFGLFSPGIDNAAHLGGLAMGVALGFMVKPAERTQHVPPPRSGYGTCWPSWASGSWCCRSRSRSSTGG